VRTGATSQPLVAGFAATADPAVSFDATHVLFSGKRNADDHWQIWETAVNGGVPVQLTSCADDCVRPFYLPGDRLVFARKASGRFEIAVSDRQQNIQQLTYLPGNAFPTDVLRDGRILFEAGDPLGSNASSEIFAVYSDGSGVESYRCDHGMARHSGRQLASGDIVFAKDNGLARFTSALAHEVDVPNAKGDFAGDVVEDAHGQWVLPRRPSADAAYVLERWGALGTSPERIVSIPSTDVVQPQFLSPRQVPNQHPSGLHDWDGANLLCLNAYSSKLKIPAGSISSLRVYTHTPQGETYLLGSSQVEEGSFFLHVPSEQPLQIELLDSAGATVQREHGWFWMKRGEQRECVGCHAGPERSPENAVPAVLLRSTDPVDMTNGAASRQGVH
jgi:hypothetical protein